MFTKKSKKGKMSFPVARAAAGSKGMLPEPTGTVTMALAAAPLKGVLPELTGTATITQTTPEKRLCANLQETISVRDSPDQLTGSKLEEAISITDSPSALAVQLYKGVIYDWRENKKEQVIVLSKDAEDMQSRIRQHFPKISLTKEMHTFISDLSKLDPRHKPRKDDLDAGEAWNLDPPLLVMPFLCFKPSFYQPLLHQLSNMSFKKADGKKGNLNLKLFPDQISKSCRLQNVLPRVYVCWLCPRMLPPKRMGKKEYAKRIKQEKSNLTLFFKKQFNAISTADEKSIRDSIEKNETFYICGFGSDNARIILAAATYVRSQFGIWVNWLAVSRQAMNHYGQSLDIRRYGVGSYLLQFPQMQSAAVDWKVDIYLNTSPVGPAMSFYAAKGFQEIRTNELDELPKELIDDVQQHDGYIHFISTSDQEALILADTPDVDLPNEEVTKLQRSEFLRLIKREGPIQQQHDDDKVLYVGNSDQATINLKASAKLPFAKFPFYSTGKMLNQLCHDLLFVNLSFLKYRDEEQTIFEIPLDRKTFKSFGHISDVDGATYLELQEDNHDQTFALWVNDSYVQFVQSWLLRDKHSALQSVTTCIPPVLR